MITIPSHPNYRRNLDRVKAGETPCVICGKGVRSPVHFVHVVNGGASLALPGEEVAPGGDMDYFPIGPDCVRRHPELRPFVTTQGGHHDR